MLDTIAGASSPRCDSLREQVSDWGEKMQRAG